MRARAKYEAQITFVSQTHGEALSVRNAQTSSTLGTEIDTSLAHVALELPKPQFRELLFTVGANWQDLFLLVSRYHIVLQLGGNKLLSGGLTFCFSCRPVGARLAQSKRVTNC